MTILAFYFLLWPGEYILLSAEYATPFWLQDIHLFQGLPKHHLTTCTMAKLWTATYVGLEFTNQKNGIKGEIIGLGKSGSNTWCPMLAVIHCIIALYWVHAPPTMPLHAYSTAGHWYGVTASHITAQLQVAALTMGTQYGLLPANISTCSL